MIPEKVQSGGPLHLTTVKKDGKGKVENYQRADDCQGNVVSKKGENNIRIKDFLNKFLKNVLMSTLKKLVVGVLNDQQEDGGHGQKEGGF